MSECAFPTVCGVPLAGAAPRASPLRSEVAPTLGRAARVRLALRDALRTEHLPPAPGPFVLGINLGGPPLRLGGQAWWGHAEALQRGLECPGAQTLQRPLEPIPHLGPDWRSLISSGVFRSQTLQLSLPVPEGRHGLVLWLAENWQRHWHSLSLRIDGRLVAQRLGELPVGGWETCGPYLLEGPARPLALSLDSGSASVDAHLMGLALYRL